VCSSDLIEALVEDSKTGKTQKDLTTAVNRKEDELETNVQSNGMDVSDVGSDDATGDGSMDMGF
jgi:hypothetical protein